MARGGQFDAGGQEWGETEGRVGSMIERKRVGSGGNGRTRASGRQRHEDEEQWKPMIAPV